MCSKLLCACGCCFIPAIWGVVIFFIVVSASVNRRNVHHILEDVIISDVSIAELHNPANDSQLNCTMVFKVRSRNPNKMLGVSFWHFRIAAVYDGMELGRAYVAPFVQFPRNNITHLETSLVTTAVLPEERASKLRADVASGFVPIRINVKVRARFKRVDRSWKTKISGGGELHGDDKCGLSVKLDGPSSHLRGRECGWTVRVYIPNDQ